MGFTDWFKEERENRERQAYLWITTYAARIGKGTPRDQKAAEIAADSAVAAYSIRFVPQRATKAA